MKTAVLLLLAVAGSIALVAQTPPHIKQATLTSAGQLRLSVEPIQPNADALSVQSASSPLGSWTKQSDAQRQDAVGGYDFLIPLGNQDSQRYFRIVLEGSLPPHIRYIAPNKAVRPGQLLSVLGDHFEATPDSNTVTFELPNQSWTVPALEAAPNYLTLRAPTNLFTTTSSTGVLYRVTVTTKAGPGNGVGCNVVQSSFDTLSLKPNTAYIIQAPGSGKETLLIGGGVPPYQLFPLSTADAAKLTAQLEGSLVHLTAATNVLFADIRVGVQDSSSPRPLSASCIVSIVRGNFAPALTTTFPTLLAGSAPGLTLTAELFNSDARPAQLEGKFKNAQVDVSQVQPNATVGLMRLFFSGSPYGFQLLRATDVSLGRANFDIVSLDGGGEVKVGEGSLTESPPGFLVSALDQQAETLMSTTFYEEIIFSDNLFRLPAEADQKFTLTSTLTSVSLQEGASVPLTKSFTNDFTTTKVDAGAPRLERLLPMQGEEFRAVHLRGSGFDANVTNNQVTFAGLNGARLTAEILSSTNNELVVAVPHGAVTGPIRITANGKVSNDFLFSVRFHPEALLLFDTLTADTPATFRLIHQQPTDDHETADEIALQSVVASIDQGRLELSNVTSNQVVGTAKVVNFYTKRSATNLIVYQGRESSPPNRHVFGVMPSVGSKAVVARAYAQDDPSGNGVKFEGGAGIIPFNPGFMLDYRFTTPIYRPPAASGTALTIRVEAVSQQWMAPPDSEMRVVQLTSRTVQ